MNKNVNVQKSLQNIEDIISTYDKDSQIRLRKDLEQFETIEQKCSFMRNLLLQKLDRTISLLKEDMQPFYIKLWKTIKEKKGVIILRKD